MDWQNILKNIKWLEGKKVDLPTFSHRYAMTVVCTKAGHLDGKFLNGIRRYAILTTIVRHDGITRIYDGVIVVPVIPDGRLLMVVNQRPGADFFYDHPRIIRLGKKKVDLGAYGSLEFPGGGIDKNDKDGITKAFLRELWEETGVAAQKAVMYRRMFPIYPMNSDIIGRMHFAVVYLSSGIFSKYVESDGGLSVLALTPAQIERNIRGGVIASGHAALPAWNFFQEVERLRLNKKLLRKLRDEGYISFRKVAIKKT